MPELPEVEVTRRRIAPLLLGRRIREVETTRDSYLFLTRPNRLRSRLTGRSVVALLRRGKYLICVLDEGSRLVIHLGMTGQFFSGAATSPRLLSVTARASLSPAEQIDFQPDSHTHLRLAFEDEGPRVFLRDVRKFGKILLLDPGEQHPRLERLGIDALEVNGEHLFRATRKRQLVIKNLLLQQSVITGVGNIYADEALFCAGLRPTRRAGRVSRAECGVLADAIRAILERSIEMGGSSIRDFVAPDGSDGSYQDERRVYARAGQACDVCGTPIKKIVLGQRGTHYCPVCQR
ncbi:MAG: bifunctional DNA-formamidopyrimidine glycosylase/DNA-(apurinic or apyrimidinic site) lyase [Myxococcales bacterium]|nr:bifunctional DNA-formamidopyrimidine glycosylase/DNA-(apurinic or apyrimidinic site) lyase [Myxococcales bacterium]TDJ16883.1 MAG: bifunctional DNA-formamidopyrimidine glycosylase/DNA-(apurinic or apyrimidinic site) lyase [Deltaproteobacteria bacterium]